MVNLFRPAGWLTIIPVAVVNNVPFAVHFSDPYVYCSMTSKYFFKALSYKALTFYTKHPELNYVGLPD